MRFDLMSDHDAPTSPDDDGHGCGDGWLSYGSQCYVFPSDRTYKATTWAQAMSACARVDAVRGRFHGPKMLLVFMVIFGFLIIVSDSHPSAVGFMRIYLAFCAPPGTCLHRKSKAE